MLWPTLYCVPVGVVVRSSVSRPTSFLIGESGPWSLGRTCVLSARRSTTPLGVVTESASVLSACKRSTRAWSHCPRVSLEYWTTSPTWNPGLAPPRAGDPLYGIRLLSRVSPPGQARACALRSRAVRCARVLWPPACVYVRQPTRRGARARARARVEPPAGGYPLGVPSPIRGLHVLQPKSSHDPRTHRVTACRMIRNLNTAFRILHVVTQHQPRVTACRNIYSHSPTVPIRIGSY
eukprot:COSAG02_NODE_3260_length_7078_cov_6.096432_3_plen_236_part_00